MLNKDYFHNDQVRKRFVQEAQIMAKLNHKNICSVISLEDNTEFSAIVMEYMEGQDLGAYVNTKGAVPESTVWDWLEQIAPALDYAHSQKVVHRDLKPSNFFLTHSGEIKIMDFGIAKVAESLVSTQTNSKMGSVVYMSPEQIQSPKYVDYRTDIYSLGVTLHHLLSGKIPYDTTTGSEFQIMKQITEEKLEKLRVSKEMNSRIEWATKKDRADRPKKVTDLSVAQPRPNLVEADRTLINYPEEQADKTLIDFPKEQNEKSQSVFIKEKEYKTVRIGTQVWMAENLNYVVEGSYCYDDDSSNCAKYGRLYTWGAAMQAASEISGWHLPSDEEWDELAEALGGQRDEYGSYPDIGRKLKSTSGWADEGLWNKLTKHSEFTNGNNSSGFNALPSGYRSHLGYFIDRGKYAGFWSATQRAKGGRLVKGRHMFDISSDFDHTSFNRNSAQAVRLVKD